MGHNYFVLALICITIFLAAWYISRSYWVGIFCALTVFLGPLFGRFDSVLCRHAEFFINSGCGPSNVFCKFIKSLMIMLLPVSKGPGGGVKVDYFIMNSSPSVPTPSLLFIVIIGMIALLIAYLSGKLSNR